MNMMNDEILETVNGGAAARINYDTGKYILYRVVPNDCLSMIAQRYGVALEVVYAINKNVIGPNMNLIQPDMILKIPTL